MWMNGTCSGATAEETDAALTVHPPSGSMPAHRGGPANNLLVSRFPLREELRGQLMLALYRREPHR